MIPMRGTPDCPGMGSRGPPRDAPARSVRRRLGPRRRPHVRRAAPPTPTGSIGCMTASNADPRTTSRHGRGVPLHQGEVLLYSDDFTTRDAVARRGSSAGQGRRGGPLARVRDRGRGRQAVETERFDMLILDGEAAKVGGLGLTRQLKNEIFNCPPVIVLTGRPQDAWLAAWSKADPRCRTRWTRST